MSTWSGRSPTFSSKHSTWKSPPQDIDPEAPLYGEGLGLDSIDILEVALIVSKKYGVQLRADSQENHKIFRSLRHLAEYIAAQRTK